ncbi:MAG: hypothetical protein ISN64_01645 [Rickettsia sp.]|nr:hypothetical protein [Rickettsia sp.]
MKIKNFFLIVIILYAKSIFALDYQGNDEDFMSLKISNSGFTRIFFPGEKTVDVFIYPEEQADLTLNSLEQIVLVPRKITKEALFLSIVTDKNTIQDLSILFVDKKPEAIRLLSKNFNNKKEKKNEDNNHK